VYEVRRLEKLPGDGQTLEVEVQ